MRFIPFFNNKLKKQTHLLGLLLCINNQPFVYSYAANQPVRIVYLGRTR